VQLGRDLVIHTSLKLIGQPSSGTRTRNKYDAKIQLCGHGCGQNPLMGGLLGLDILE